MGIKITLKTGSFIIDEEIFELLLGNTVAATYSGFERCLDSSSLPWSELVKLSEYARIPLPLFFAPKALVEDQLKANEASLLCGVSKTNYSINGRGNIDLRMIELIVKDLIRKQQFLKGWDTSLTDNHLLGILSRTGESAVDSSARLMDALAITHQDLWNQTTHRGCLDFLIHRLEENQVLVSQSVDHFMPQRLRGVELSGITIKDRKIPYIFLAGGSFNEDIEPTGRRIFTLVLLLVLITRNIFSPVTYNAASRNPIGSREYDIAAELLMPKRSVLNHSLTDITAIKKVARSFHVTPSALVIRGLRLNIFTHTIATSYLNELDEEFQIKPKGGGRTPRPAMAVRKYAGNEFIQRALQLYDQRLFPKREFLRVACLNKLPPSAINELRVS